MGASAGLTMLMSMVRVKLAAVMIGAVGVGMMSGYNALFAAVVTLLGLGVQTSAVREIAMAHSFGHRKGLAATVLATKRLCWILACVGLVLTALLSTSLSEWAFGDSSHASGVAVLSVVVLLNIVNNAYSATIQGVRQIGDLARANVWGAAGGTLVSVYCFWKWGTDGVVGALLGVAMAQTLSTAFFARRVNLLAISQTWRESMELSWCLIRQGAPLMLSSFAATLSTFLILAMITRELSLSSAGFYSAAFALSGMFVGFVLTSMGADYYPRLSSTSDDQLLMGKMVNEQTEVGLLLTVPGLLLCWVLAPWLVELFYTNTFLPATELLQWFLLGCLGRVISWPMGFVLLALGRSKTFLFSELLVNTVHVGLVWWAVQVDSLAYTARAFCLTYVFYTLLMLWICRRLIGLQWSSFVLRTVLTSIVQFLLIIAILYFFNGAISVLAALLVITLSALLSVKMVIRMLGDNHRIVRKLLQLPFMAQWLKG
jgi:enterobacterial common antigen flippase